MSSSSSDEPASSESEDSDFEAALGAAHISKGCARPAALATGTAQLANSASCSWSFQTLIRHFARYHACSCVL